MTVSSLNQTYVFLMSVASGAAMGLIFDFFRAMRKTKKSCDLSVGIQDVLFFIISAAMVFSFMYRANYAEPNWYVFLGIGIGITLYNATVSKAVIKIFVWCFDTIAKILTALLKIIIFPIKFVLRLLRVPILFVCVPVCKIWRFFQMKIKLFNYKIKTKFKKIKKSLKMY